MTLPRYPSYKDSGVEWLGEVPEHWKVLPLKRSFQIVGGSHGPTVSKRLHLFQNQLNSSVLVVWRIFVFAQDAFDHQPQLGLHAFAG